MEESMPPPRASIGAELLPRWTAYAVPELGGRDPLGLSRVEQRLVDLLMRGITAQTRRARYYSLYPWILWDIEREGQGRTKTDFLAAFARREAAIAVATGIRGETSSVVGDQVVRRILGARAGAIEVNTQVQMLTSASHRLGGYGQIYGGSLVALGLTGQDEHGIQHVAEGLGAQLAEAAAESLAKAPYVTKRLHRKALVEWRELEASAERLSLDGIRESWAAAERGGVLDALFDRQAPRKLTVPSLRSSLVGLLKVLAAYEDIGLPVEAEEIDLQVLYGPAYFGVLVRDDLGASVPYQPLEALATTSAYWREFCLHQYLTWALESILAAVLDELGGASLGLERAELARRLTGQEFSSYFDGEVGVAARTPASFLRSLGLAGVPTAELCAQVRRQRTIDAADSEEVLARGEEESAAETVARACHLLGALYARWRSVSTDPVHSDMRASAGGDLAAATVLPLLDAWWAASNWTEVVSSLVGFLSAHHDRVMYEKGRLESCWLGHDGERLVNEQGYVRYFRQPRQRQALSILTDLLIVEMGDRVRLTAAGRDLLAAELARG